MHAFHRSFLIAFNHQFPRYTILSGKQLFCAFQITCAHFKLKCAHFFFWVLALSSSKVFRAKDQKAVCVNASSKKVKWKGNFQQLRPVQTDIFAFSESTRTGNATASLYQELSFDHTIFQILEHDFTKSEYKNFTHSINVVSWRKIQMTVELGCHCWQSLPFWSELLGLFAFQKSEF